MNMIMFCQESRHFFDIDKFRRMLEQDPGVSKTRHRHEGFWETTMLSVGYRQLHGVVKKQLR